MADQIQISESEQSAQEMAGESETAESGSKNKIIDAAYRCFERFGFEKTTIGDISKEASISRPNFYKMFKNKDAVIIEICYREMRAQRDQFKALERKYKKPEDILAHGLLISIRGSQKNKYLRYHVESDEVMARTMKIVDPNDPAYPLLRKYWENGLLPYLDKKILERLSFDDIVSWLAFCQVTMLKRLDYANLSDKELLKFVRQFIVQPLTLASSDN